ncbi:ABC-type phosphate/phosphonate transport system substrate-binding protein [Pseudoduganella lurida]|uniref:ABC-type phosphate/phosphonate transport system substrate-binding protein n=1 Tax=Pseudoduganella lurida TaxID=1036180 RepID=A0A562QXD9_9BURK|nr:PhnD/SsuA/transferrin family substrate-binding protein [Pseudoduganella lurida]TWI60796.1 ABC-type phosphate/phosphonate transport system substrate-binding protein [Pseudoduganella lurida]
MTWLAALPMYNVSSRLRLAYETFLAALLVQADVGEPVDIVRDAALPDIWREPDLLLSQTCGYPYITALRSHVTLLATPCFDVSGCAGSDYSSVIVARTGSGIATLADARGRAAAVNDVHSNSGMNALRHAVAPLARDGRFFADVTWSGSHAASLRLVREGAADIAAIDCVTFAYLQEEDPASVEDVVTLGFTAASPGLPLVASKAVPEAVVQCLRAALLAPGPALCEALAPLRIRGFVHRDDADYARIGRMEQEAAALGYPALR